MALGSAWVLSFAASASWRAGRRRRRRTVAARMDIPGWVAGGTVITYHVDPEGDSPNALGIYIEYVPADSSRVLSHYFGAGIQLSSTSSCDPYRPETFFRGPRSQGSGSSASSDGARPPRSTRRRSSSWIDPSR